MMIWINRGIPAIVGALGLWMGYQAIDYPHIDDWKLLRSIVLLLIARRLLDDDMQERANRTFRQLFPKKEGKAK